MNTYRYRIHQRVRIARDIVGLTPETVGKEGTVCSEYMWSDQYGVWGYAVAVVGCSTNYIFALPEELEPLVPPLRLVGKDEVPA